jgi:ribA/ribD-fused uncharacterized protein
MIEQFKGEYRWLSNFAPVVIHIDGIDYPSVEHAYMSCKSDDDSWKAYCSDPDNSAGTVKVKSREIDLINGWHSKKLGVMEMCLRQKFSQEPYRTRLIDTGDTYIQEGNYHGDKFYGVCLRTNEGLNHLGRLIMQIRNEINTELF